MRSLERIGWVFFVAGSVVFTLVGIVNGDWLTATGGLLYVVGCGALLASANRSVAP